MNYPLILKKVIMKVLISGASFGTNFGDFLFAKMFQDFIGQQVGENNVFWHKNKYTLSDFYLKYLNYHNHPYKLSDIDVLVYMSGGYFCGRDRTVKDMVLRFFRYFGIGIRCIIRHIPICVIAIDVKESSNWFTNKIQHFILRRCQLVIVRNKESMNEVENILKGKDVEHYCSADSVFAMERSFFDNVPCAFRKGATTNKLLFLHSKPRFVCMEDFESKIIPIVNLFLKNHPEYTVVIASDQYSVKQKEVLSYISSRIATEKKEIYYYENPIALCKVLDQCDVIVTDKLHVGIVGCHLGKSVISFSGHTDKIARLYNQLGISDRTIPLKDLTIEKGFDLIESKYSDPVIVPIEIVNMAKNNFVLLSNFLKKIEEK